MKIIVGVSNFGKIRKAEIDISNFTVFVGNNNSGKTYMMQLIYGVLTELGYLKIKPDISEINYEKKYDITAKIQYIEKFINNYLKNNKEKIVMKTFHKPIPIDKLYVRLQANEECLEVKFSLEERVAENIRKENATLENKQRLVTTVAIKNIETDVVISQQKIRFLFMPSARKAWEFIYNKATDMIFNRGNNMRSDVIFIPASRTGMLLLYKNFFAEKSKNDIGNMVEYFFEDEENENELGLSMPVYEFLLFLLRYTPGQGNMEHNKKIIEFIQEKLLDGEIRQIGEETVYIPQNSDLQIPLYLSSSMINEITPLIKLLSSTSRYRRILYDEIETCLHPLKQGEMARTLVRMNNNGYRLIVSTHSDTMAAKINNLLLLSNIVESEQEKAEKLEKMNLTAEDLLKAKEFHVYQFINKKDGTSEVSELEFRQVPPTGYDFSLFMDSVNELYHESSTVME
ncbi:MAG: AAA family ATPase [Lachnospiraceae bacterium]|nr:AAA family ATPase [Lachnospiraceae bacterium]